MPDEYTEPRSYEQRYTEDRVSPSVARAPFPVYDMLAKGLESRGTMELEDVSPEEIPDISRELTMMEGALHSVEIRASQLVTRLAPILTDPQAALKIAQANGPAPRPESMAPRSEVAQRIAGYIERLGALENVLAVSETRLGV